LNTDSDFTTDDEEDEKNKGKTVEVRKIEIMSIVAIIIKNAKSK